MYKRETCLIFQFYNLLNHPLSFSIIVINLRYSDINGPVVLQMTALKQIQIFKMNITFINTNVNNNNNNKHVTLQGPAS